MARHGKRGGNGGSGGGVPLVPAVTQATSSSAVGTPSASDAGSLDTGNVYFAQFAGFEQDYDATFLANFKRLAIQEAWPKKEQKARCPDAFDAEFDLQFGTNTKKLEAWQEMCKECGITPVPPSITQCKKALRKVNINIFNFLDHRRNPELFRLIIFPNIKKLRKYTVPSRMYPLKRAKEDTFIKALLRPVLFGNKNKV
ncbi:hypothetical protein CC86DRAFT_398966 [Ophiobolus disseminans]|uniref:Uncharacterized protein n=1 Tax=Ophiobolus disseminans TaxID=1469910 RepID=A0A6A6ZE94_9PLEO|nr:hypothetical protein CC86DRAFT_398966 [Ophiobolus disseminans]